MPSITLILTDEQAVALVRGEDITIGVRRADEPFRAGERLLDWSGDPCVVTLVHDDGSFDVKWDNESFGTNGHAKGLTAASGFTRVSA